MKQILIDRYGSPEEVARFSCVSLADVRRCGPGRAWRLGGEREALVGQGLEILRESARPQGQ